ncbi:unnamed protein product [Moneuplotes crassus]|uniref:C2H2-type domain-containing protein n=1 Tax=Euplotes crassus TaxID=5936 RepID=A0AAD1U6C4_EUPCR|nr:unnamed protein product [Moneuplotes crassus]
MLPQNNTLIDNSGQVQMINQEYSNNLVGLGGQAYAHYPQDPSGNFGMDCMIPAIWDPTLNCDQSCMVPPVNSVCSQLYAINESELNNSNLHQDMTLIHQQSLCFGDMQTKLAISSMDLSGFCLCDLYSHGYPSGLNSSCTTPSGDKKSPGPKKTRCIPKTESDSTTLKGYRFKFIHEIVNGRKRKMIQCQYDGCSKEFTKTWSFLYHARMHEGVKPFECNICQRKFSQKSNLTKHSKQHLMANMSQRKRFRCSLCPKAYTERYNLRKHLKVIHGVNTNKDLSVIYH